MSETQTQNGQSKELCFYCKLNPADQKSAYEIPLSRVQPASDAAGESTGEATLEKKELPVPRCAACAQIHQRLGKIRRLSLILILGVGIGGGLLINLFLFGFQLTHPGGILFAFIFASAAATYSLVANRLTNPNQIAGEKSVLSQYPPYEDLHKQGWLP